GIRHFHVTGVQTCALPIWVRRSSRPTRSQARSARRCACWGATVAEPSTGTADSDRIVTPGADEIERAAEAALRPKRLDDFVGQRSEERRVGNERMQRRERR